MATNKQCKDCSLVKSLNYFNKNPNGILNVEPRCKICQSLYNKQYRLKNKEKISLQKKENYKKNKEIIIYKVKEYRINNLEKIKVKKQEYYKKNKPIIIEKCRIYVNKKRKTDSIFKLKESLRHRINICLKSKKLLKNNNLDKYLGCSIEELKFWLEFWFENGMTWKNHGEWHIDHIIPLGSEKTSENIFKLCHYSNLQPLWLKDHYLKTIQDRKFIKSKGLS